MAKKNNFILLEEMGDAFRHSGQNPSEDVIKDMMEKAKAAKQTKPNEMQDDGLWSLSNETNKDLLF